MFVDKIYVIERADGLVKIGKSSRPEVRLTLIKSRHKQDARLVAVREAAPHGPEYAEGEVMHLLADHHAFGEWFHISPEDALAAVDAVIARPAGQCQLTSAQARNLRKNKGGRPTVELTLDPDVHELLVRFAQVRSTPLTDILRPIIEALAWRAKKVVEDPTYAPKFVRSTLTKEERAAFGLPGKRRHWNLQHKASVADYEIHKPGTVADEALAAILSGE